MEFQPTRIGLFSTTQQNRGELHFLASQAITRETELEQIFKPAKEILSQVSQNFDISFCDKILSIKEVVYLKMISLIFF